MSQFFDDIAIGDRAELGSYTFTRENILAFAGKYDPQPFHLSEEEAARTHFGRLVASGWHTASVFMKLNVAAMKARAQEMINAGQRPARFGPSPGFSNLKWIKPVYPGDTLSYRSTVTGKTPSKSRPQWGLLHFDVEAHNQDGALAFCFCGKVFVERRGL
ncbi:MaoC family dehydratase [Roseibium denhamense]|uniref:Acyl dehydratase n=1 Tax=Roseibium denhamense TaxID=76305 RepID=A0ABY1NG81_9HYPH|nr:MaoC family dehydratase [Roseibium denhamense]MTI06326.1 MaoC family dehydratase [Roseibium denhamense]SMP08271.1 Acyl dehydratase [Roseibium denhamense]